MNGLQRPEDFLGPATDHGELARQAADLKKRAKAVAGSVYLRSDREMGTRSIA